MSQVIEFFRHTYPNTMTFTREVDEWRAYLGRFGISGRLQVCTLAPFPPVCMLYARHRSGFHVLLYIL